MFSTQHHKKGDFLLEYVGESLTLEEAEQKEKKQVENMMFFFKYRGKDHWYAFEFVNYNQE